MTLDLLNEKIRKRKDNSERRRLRLRRERFVMAAMNGLLAYHGAYGPATSWGSSMYNLAIMHADATLKALDESETK